VTEALLVWNGLVADVIDVHRDTADVGGHARGMHARSWSVCSGNALDADVDRARDDARDRARNAEKGAAGTEPEGALNDPLPAQKETGVFRRDLSVTWILAVIRAIVHAASREVQGGRLAEAEAEDVLLSTAVAAISERSD